MVLRLPLATIEAATGGAPNVRNPLATIEAATRGLPNVRAALVALEAATGGIPNVRCPLVVIEVLTQIPTVTVPPPIYPTVPGLTYPISKATTWSTQVFDAGSGARYRNENYAWPIWMFTLTYDAQASNGAYTGVGTDSYQTITGFYNFMRGRSSAFLFQDDTDYQVTTGYIATGDGSTSQFTLVRSLDGNFNEPVGWVLAGDLTAVYVNGVVLPTNAYTLTAPNILTITSGAPASGAVITASFTFYFLCCFNDDKLESDQFMNNLWETKQVVLRSLVLPSSS